MKYDLARLELQRVLKEQKTVTTAKVKMLLNSMSFSYNKSQDELVDERAKFLMKQLEEKNLLLDKYRKQIKNQKKYIKRLEEAQEHKEK